MNVGSLSFVQEQVVLLRSSVCCLRGAISLTVGGALAYGVACCKHGLYKHVVEGAASVPRNEIYWRESLLNQGSSSDAGVYQRLRTAYLRCGCLYRRLSVSCLMCFPGTICWLLESQLDRGLMEGVWRGVEEKRGLISASLSYLWHCAWSLVAYWAEDHVALRTMETRCSFSLVKCLCFLRAQLCWKGFLSWLLAVMVLKEYIQSGPPGKFFFLRTRLQHLGQGLWFSQLKPVQSSGANFISLPGKDRETKHLCGSSRVIIGFPAVSHACFLSCLITDLHCELVSLHICETGMTAENNFR